MTKKEKKREETSNQMVPSSLANIPIDRSLERIETTPKRPGKEPQVGSDPGPLDRTS